MNTLDYVVHNSIFSRIHKIPKISRIPQYLNDKVLSVYQYLPVVFPLAISSSSARPFSECPRWPSVLRKGSSRPCHWPHIFSQCILMVWDNLKSAWIGLVHTWNLVATHIPCSLCVCANKKGRKQLKLQRGARVMFSMPLIEVYLELVDSDLHLPASKSCCYTVSSVCSW